MAKLRPLRRGRRRGLAVFNAGPGGPVVADVQAATGAPLLGFNDHPLDGGAPADAATMLDRVTPYDWGDEAQVDWHEADVDLDGEPKRMQAWALADTGPPCPP